MAENHSHRCGYGRYIPLHGTQKIGRLRTGRLVRCDPEQRRHSRLGIRIIGRQRRTFVQIVVPQQPRSGKCRTVVGHRPVDDEIARSAYDTQSDPIARIEIKSRNTRLDRRINPDTDRRSGFLMAASDHRRDRRNCKKRPFHKLETDELEPSIANLRLFVLFPKYSTRFIITERI